MKHLSSVATGIGTGLLVGWLLSAGVAYVFMVWGADPSKDPLLSW